MSLSGGEILGKYVAREKMRFDNNISWSRGRGNKIFFLKVSWLGNSSLLERFPRMYANSITQEGKVEDIRSWNNGVCE